jgi:uncharacterized membrane protein YjgN (DUF898 family)
VPSASRSAESLTFTGSGAEYFRIWIVNLTLSILTLGIYSPWAKVRRLQYFHRHTRLGGSGFDYHGRPGAILKGRVLALVLLGSLDAAYNIDRTAGIALTIPVVVALPWLVMRSLAFRLRNTSWRGIRFGFAPRLADAYRALLMWPVLAILTLGALLPRAWRELKAFQHGNSRFGRDAFAFHVPTRAVYRVFGQALGIFLLAPLAIGLAGVALLGGLDSGVDPRLDLAWTWLFIGGFAALYAGFVAVKPFLHAHLQNLVWNGTTLGEHAFESRLRFTALLWITLSNLVLTLVSLGLFRPFAVVRLARYRIECMTLDVAGSLDDFSAEQGADVDAFGEEVGEFMDIDIAL